MQLDTLRSVRRKVKAGVRARLLPASGPPAQAEPVVDVIGGRALSLLREGWYSMRYPEVALSGQTPSGHFAEHGFGEGRDPMPLFDSVWYRTQVPALPPGMSPLEHYLRTGAGAGFDPCPGFDSAWYMRQLGGQLGPHTTPLEHYLHIGWAQGFDPHPLFCTAWYMERNGDVRLADFTPLEHYLEIGWKLGLQPSALFNGERYLELNDDVRQAGANPMLHYSEHGVEERRTVSNIFDATAYAKNAGDDPLIRTLDPLVHFIHFGFPIGRAASPDRRAAAIAALLLSAERRSKGSFGAAVSVPGELAVGEPGVDWNARVDRLEVPRSDVPLVSVIIPTFNHSEDVIRCLESICHAGDKTSIEVVLVDDASSPRHADRFERIAGLRVVRLDRNAGFAGACTAGVAASSGAYVLLLNNDTEVLPGWIDSLVAELDTHPDTGIVGSMIIRPDLMLQEAGCIIWSDGGGYQYGSGCDPLDFVYRTRREVDYCSGASLLIRRELWDRVDGFDERFSPAYYEDADLCFAARHAGYKVVYEPQSVVIHNEGTSHGRDSSGTKRFQFRNKQLFQEKWAMSLMGHPSGFEAVPSGGLLRLRDRRTNGHVLVVDHRVPAPDHDAGSLRIVRLMEALAERGYVVHFLPGDVARRDPWAEYLENNGVEIITNRKIRDDFLRAIEPMTEFVILSRPDIAAEHLSLMLDTMPTVPIVYDMVDAHAQRLRRSAALFGRPELSTEADRFERLEVAMARVSDVVVTVSDADESFIKEAARIAIRTVRLPTIHYAEEHGPEYAARAGLLFVGGFEHTPNVDAAFHLVYDLLPLIRERIGDVHVTIAGSKPPPELMRLRTPDVTVTGWVPLLRPLYDRTRLVVAPLRFGAGVKGKIGEALSHGVPTVTTSIGVEGIDVRPGVDILVGDSPAEFADAVAEAYTSQDRWNSLRHNGAAAIENQFGRTAISVRIDQLIEVVGQADRRRKRSPDANATPSLTGTGGC